MLFKVAGFVDAEAAKAGGGLVQLHNGNAGEADKEPASEQGTGDVHTGAGSAKLSMTLISKLHICINRTEVLKEKSTPKGLCMDC